MPTRPALPGARSSRARVRLQVLGLLRDGLHVTAMTIVGMLAVWALVLIFG